MEEQATASAEKCADEEVKDSITFPEFKSWLTRLIIGKKGAIPDLDDWRKIKDMIDKVVPEKEIQIVPITTTNVQDQDNYDFKMYPATFFSETDADKDAGNPFPYIQEPDLPHIIWGGASDNTKKDINGPRITNKPVGFGIRTLNTDDKED